MNIVISVVTYTMKPTSALYFKSDRVFERMWLTIATQFNCGTVKKFKKKTTETRM